MDWRKKLETLLEPYSPPIETEEGIFTELVDEEGEVYDRLAFYVENPEGEWPLVEALVEAVQDLTDHDIPGRNVFAFGFRPEFNGMTIRVSFFNAEGGKGAVVGEVPEKLVEIAEKNGLPLLWAEGEGIGLPRDHTEKDFETLVKLVEAIAFEW